MLLSCHALKVAMLLGCHTLKVTIILNILLPIIPGIVKIDKTCNKDPIAFKIRRETNKSFSVFLNLSLLKYITIRANT